ncbi:MAG: aminopeptidase P family N-terminal domain-containing protein [Candidatus Binatia bacterium]
MDQEIIARLKQRITREGLDAIIAISPENVTYVSGFVVPSQALMRWRHAICILTADGRISMVAIDMESTTVKAHAGIDDLRRDASNRLQTKKETKKQVAKERGREGVVFKVRT